MMLVDEQKLKQSQWEYRYLFTGTHQWRCAHCKNDQGKRTTPLVCTDVQEYIFTVGEGKEAKLNRGWCVRGICPQCMNEATTPLKDEYTQSYCESDTMNLIWHNKLRPSWLIPPKEWQDCGAPLHPLVDEDAVGPISLSLKNKRDRVVETKRRYDPTYRSEKQADAHVKTVLLRKEVPAVAEAHNLPLGEETPQVDDNASIYEFYDPYDY